MDKKALIKSMVEDIEKEIMKLELFEKYYAMKQIKEPKFLNALGQTQGSLRANRELLEFLKKQ